MNNVIFGAGQRAREIKYLLGIENIHVDCFIVDKEYISSPMYDNTTVISTEKFFKLYSPDDTNVFLGVGMPKMNKIRERLFEKFHSNGFAFQKYISPFANVLSDKIGEGTTVFAGVNIGPNVKIGKGNHFEMGVTISHDCTIGDYNFFAPGCSLCGDITIDKGSFFGANCTVKNSIKIGSYVLIGAGSYADKNLPDYSVLLPARSSLIQDKDSTYFMDK